VLAWGLALMRPERWQSIVGFMGPSASPGVGRDHIQAAKEKAVIRSLARLEAMNRLRMLLAVLAVAVAAAVLAACSSSGTSSTGGGSSSPVAATSGGLKTTTIGGATVLTDAKGFTLYSFAPDTPTKSNCNGTCAQNWPPVKGPATASGVKGTFGTIKRSNGATQATFDGHPLYTYVGDTAPGQANGNGLNVAGGLWHEVTTSGSAAAGSSSSGSGGGGY
jgi:predicted lipoprotein with Yx(FWY)xxD motif